MYKLVIIDDEPLIREGLKKYLDWESYGFTICGEAEDGTKGIELCRKLRPDAVITDIRMPGKDGIELIDELKGDLKNTKFIILSGFGEFELAQKAIRLGAYDYILKPLNKEQLIHTIVTMKDLLDQFHKESQKSSMISDVINKNAYLLKSTVITNILNGNITTLQNEIDYFKIKGSYYTVLSFEHDSFSEGNHQGEMEEILNAIEGFIDRNNLKWHIGQYQDNNLIICCMEKPCLEEIKKTIDLLINEFYENIGKWLYVGIGEITRDLNDARVSCQSALQNLEGRFYKNSEHVFECMPDYVDEDLQKKYLNIENESLIISAIQNGDLPKLETAYSSLIENINLSGYHKPKDVKAFFGNLVARILARIKDIEYKDFNFEQIIKHIYSQKSYQGLIEYVNNILAKLCALYGKDGNTDSRKLIKEIKRYIQENISHEITLNTIASRFHMNLFYISHLFKKETNMNFLDYLTSLRIEKAKELLSDVNNKIYEVAIKVGYDDQRYFSQVFKKYTGYTPMEYRNRRS